MTHGRRPSQGGGSPASVRRIGAAIIAFLAFGSSVGRAGGIPGKVKDKAVVLNCGIAECTCWSHKSEVKVNCTGVSRLRVTSAEAEGGAWEFPANTSLM